ncbi:uncharacterized protein UDID_17048 [Ustilago sp. UG-2017a]|nr:uncharacterized protein UDID_17048 [Ustilago sp. UG-2017a]
MIIWDDSMPEPAVSLAFAATTTATDTEQPHRFGNKASLWHHRLGHATHDVIMQTRVATLSHDIPLTPAIHPGDLCDVCTQSKATARNVAHPRQVNKPLELVLMDVMGPLHGTTQYSYVLIIHDAHSSMIWRPSEVVLDHGIKEVRVDQGELWSATFRELCSSMGVKISTSPTQQHTNNAFAKWAIQTIQKITRSLIYDSGMDKRWWPHATLQAAFIHNRLAGTTRGNVTPFELFFANTFGHALFEEHTWVSRMNHMLSKATRFGFQNLTVVVAKDVRFSELEQPGADPNPFHKCVLAGDNGLLRSYTWFPPDEVSDKTEPDDVMPLSLPLYSRQRDSELNSSSSPSDISSFGH